jgi:hypothetical protein
VQFSVLLSRKLTDDMDRVCDGKVFLTKNEAFEYLLRKGVNSENLSDAQEKKLWEAYMAGFQYCADRVTAKYRTRPMKTCISSAKKFVVDKFNDWLAQY